MVQPPTQQRIPESDEADTLLDLVLRWCTEQSSPISAMDLFLAFPEPTCSELNWAIVELADRGQLRYATGRLCGSESFWVLDKILPAPPVLNAKSPSGRQGYNSPYKMRPENGLPFEEKCDASESVWQRSGIGFRTERRR